MNNKGADHYKKQTSLDIELLIKTINLTGGQRDSLLLAKRACDFFSNNKSSRITYELAIEILEDLNDNTTEDYPRQKQIVANAIRGINAYLTQTNRKRK